MRIQNFRRYFNYGKIYAVSQLDYNLLFSWQTILQKEKAFCTSWRPPSAKETWKSNASRSLRHYFPSTSAREKCYQSALLRFCFGKCSERHCFSRRRFIAASYIILNTESPIAGGSSYISRLLSFNTLYISIITSSVRIS